MVILEELEHAKARGARIYGELVGYGATSDGYDMVQPSGEGAARCMRLAMQGVDGIDYINPHATSTPIGDVKEIEAIREVFGDKSPPISATKSLTGHSLGAAGAHEAIYSLLMMNNGFICRDPPISRPSIRRWPTCRSCASVRTMSRSTASCPTASASAAPMPPSSSAAITARPGLQPLSPLTRVSP